MEINPTSASLGEKSREKFVSLRATTGGAESNFLMSCIGTTSSYEVEAGKASTLRAHNNNNMVKAGSTSNCMTGSAEVFNTMRPTPPISPPSRGAESKNRGIDTSACTFLHGSPNHDNIASSSSAGHRCSLSLTSSCANHPVDDHKAIPSSSSVHSDQRNAGIHSTLSTVLSSSGGMKSEYCSSGPPTNPPPPPPYSLYNGGAAPFSLPHCHPPPPIQSSFPLSSSSRFLASPSPACSLPFPWIQLNVGGKKFLTSHLTLQTQPDSVLGQLSQLLLKKRVAHREDIVEGGRRGAILSTTTFSPYSSSFVSSSSSPFSELLPVDVDIDPMDGSVLLDMDPFVFSHILEYLRAEEKRSTRGGGGRDAGEVVGWSVPRGGAVDISRLRAMAKELRLVQLERQLHPRRCLLAWGTASAGEFGVGGCGGDRFPPEKAPPISPSSQSRPSSEAENPTRPGGAAGAEVPPPAERVSAPSPAPAPPPVETFATSPAETSGTSAPDTSATPSTAERDRAAAGSPAAVTSAARTAEAEKGIRISKRSIMLRRPMEMQEFSTRPRRWQREQRRDTSPTESEEEDEEEEEEEGEDGIETREDLPHKAAEDTTLTTSKAEAPATVECATPHRYHLPGRVVQVALGMDCVYYRSDQGEVWVCGEGRKGQLGLGEGYPIGVDVPRRVRFPALPSRGRVGAFPAPGMHIATTSTLGITADDEGNVTSMKNKKRKHRVNEGNVDNTSPPWQLLPPLVDGVEEGSHAVQGRVKEGKGKKIKEEEREEGEYFISHVSCSSTCATAVTQDHHVFFWGSNEYSQGGLGQGLYFTSECHTVLSPVCIHALEPTFGMRIVETCCGLAFGMARSLEGNVYTWGAEECIGLGQDIVARLQEREVMEANERLEEERQRWGIRYPGGDLHQNEKKGESTSPDGWQKISQCEERMIMMEEEEALNAVLEARRNREGGGGGGSNHTRRQEGDGQQQGERVRVPSIGVNDDLVEGGVRDSVPASLSSSTTPALPPLPLPACRYAGLAVGRIPRPVVLLPQLVVFPQDKKSKKNKMRRGGGGGGWTSVLTPSTPIIAIRAGSSHACALSAQGEVYTWGAGHQGRLGLGDLNPAWTPRRVEGGGLIHYRVKALSCGSLHTAALTEEGMLFMWGDNTQKQCGEVRRWNFSPPCHRDCRRRGSGGDDAESSRGSSLSSTPPGVLTIPHRVEEFDAIGRGIVTAVSCGRNFTIVIVAGPHFPPYRPLPLYYNPISPSLSSFSLSASPPSALLEGGGGSERATRIFQNRDGAGGAATALPISGYDLDRHSGGFASPSFSFSRTAASESVWKDEWSLQGQPFLMGTGSEWGSFSEVLLPLKGAALPQECIPAENTAYNTSLGLKRRSAGIRAMRGFEQYHVRNVFAGLKAAFFVAEDLHSDY